MPPTLGSVLRSSGIDPAAAQAIRHAFVWEHEDTGLLGIHANSTDEEILAYTSRQSAKPRIFPADPPRLWVVFIREGGDRARLWSVPENRGEVSNDGTLRTFDLISSDHIADLRNRLVIGWRSPRTWRLNDPTAAGYPVMEIAHLQPVPFPGFDRLVLDRAQLLAVMREHRYADWRTALSSVVGIYLITETRDGASTSARPMARRASANAGAPTRPTATAATSNCAAWIRRPSDTRSSGCSTRRRRRG